jgi:hypothetical protein
MTYQCRIKLVSHLDHGKITMGEMSERLSQKTYEHRFTAPGKKTKIFSLEELSPGLDKGVELISLEIDGFHVHEIEKFTQFEMIGNPYVENDRIKEKEFRFNGVFELDIDHSRLFWFPHYYSKRKIDFVYGNNLHTCTGVEGCWGGENLVHTEGLINAPFDRSVSPKQGDNFALGCSQTYGSAVDKNRTWPALIGYHNFGTPGAGVDSIFYNAYRIVELFKPKTMIIVFPSLSRRLLEFQRGDYFFRIPCSINDLWSGELYEKDHYWIDRKQLGEMLLNIEKQMVEDTDDQYSKNFLTRISDLPCDTYVSSWNHETYEILPKYFKNVLPFFDKIDLALDQKHHGPLSHEKWAEKIKTTISS